VAIESDDGAGVDAAVENLKSAAILDAQGKAIADGLAKMRAKIDSGMAVPYGKGEAVPVPMASGICTYCKAPRWQCSPFRCREA
jgi:hypothetical protein